MALFPPLPFGAKGGRGARLVLISGGGQTAGPGETLTDPIVVEVRDANGDPVIGVSVTATPSGDGSVDSSPKVSNGLGQVSFTWTVSTSTGDDTLTFTASGYTSTVAGAVVTFGESAQYGPMGLRLTRAA